VAAQVRFSLWSANVEAAKKGVDCRFPLICARSFHFDPMPLLLD
jgi:hypothetical protein